MYVDACLPFSLRSVPLIFTAIVDALLWIVQQRGVKMLLHYLDDFITLGLPLTQEYYHNMEAFFKTCDELGVIVASNKCEGPTSCLTFLGIEVDTGCMEMCLLEDKLVRVKHKVAGWLGKKVGRRRELDSLVGLLQHAAKVVKPKGVS